jgi:hypothetical protein
MLFARNDREVAVRLIHILRARSVVLELFVAEAGAIDDGRPIELEILTK